ncbi:hypothetical protein EMIHUDRAFT_356471, partial [Emiliania huxleyi CCMP1516]|uniref:Akirin n=2 Tax=Emiliania huxleyi TaxID=2903 RepID=A0A0D3IVS9_EMIH1
MLLACKRAREGMEEATPGWGGEPSCSPARSLLSESPAGKRTRLHAAEPAAPSASAFAAGCSDGGASQSRAIDLSAALRQRTDPHTGEVLFTLDQVRDIVRKAVIERERTLREEYDRTLQTKLQEQFQAFAKFNEDYVSRQLRQGEL